MCVCVCKMGKIHPVIFKLYKLVLKLKENPNNFQGFLPQYFRNQEVNINKDFIVVGHITSPTKLICNLLLSFGYISKIKARELSRLQRITFHEFNIGKICVFSLDKEFLTANGKYLDRNLDVEHYCDVETVLQILHCFNSLFIYIQKDKIYCNHELKIIFEYFLKIFNLNNVIEMLLTFTIGFNDVCLSDEEFHEFSQIEQEVFELLEDFFRYVK